VVRDVIYIIYRCKRTACFFQMSL